MNNTIVITILVVLAAAIGWYFFRGSSTHVAPSTAPAVQPTGALGTNNSPNQSNTGQSVVEPVLKVAHDAKLGDYLVATNGMTLYKYTKDATAVSNCSGTCAVNWPPYVHSVTEPLRGGEGATGMIATIERSDKSQQIIYNGVPLYFWKNDTKPGDTSGQNVGGVWFVVNP